MNTHKMKIRKDWNLSTFKLKWNKKKKFKHWFFFQVYCSFVGKEWGERNLESRERAFTAAITDDSIEVQRVKLSHFTLFLFSFTANVFFFQRHCISVPSKFQTAPNSIIVEIEPRAYVDYTMCGTKTNIFYYTRTKTYLIHKIFINHW